MAGDHETERPDEAEGGPVKTFLEHLEDFRWVLIKSVVTLFLAMLVCLFAANYIVQIIKWPLTRAPVGYHGTNQVVIVSFGTNHVGNFQLSPEQRQSLNLGTNRFVAVTVEPHHGRHQSGSRLAGERQFASHRRRAAGER